jgi:hypothetical protein
VFGGAADMADGRAMDAEGFGDDVVGDADMVEDVKNAAPFGKKQAALI